MAQVSAQYVAAVMISTGLLFATPDASSALAVVQTDPARNSEALTSTSISITFDEPVDLSSIDENSFRVFGKRSGSLRGTFALSNGGLTVTLQPDRALAYGEGVGVNLSHDIEAADGSFLRAAGYAFAFRTHVLPSTRTYTEIDVMSNRIAGEQTRIYGAAVMDFNGDQYVDLATINEVSEDVRVCLNRADGTGLYEPFLAPHPIGLEASPNEPADFDNDGIADLCVVAVSSRDLWVLRGNGDGTFVTTQSIDLPSQPHGVAPLDVDGDGDQDIVNANNGANYLSLHINNGAGFFAPPVNFEGGVNGEYGLAAADMNNDGITDLVVGGQNGADIRTVLGNGNGTFTPTAGGSQPAGGYIWVIAVDDVDGDGNLDASTANPGSSNASILRGLGTGRFATPFVVDVGPQTVSTDLGDADGDGDVDWMISCFGAGYWQLYENVGGGAFVFDQQFDAPNNPSCGFFLDFDNDGDLDFGLTDEIADVVILMENEGPATAAPDGLGGPSGTLGDAGSNRLVNHPDPFMSETRISFESAARGAALFEVFDPAGRRVARRTLAAQAGANEVRFDGRAESGRPLETGVYLYRLRVGGEAGGATGVGSSARVGRMTIVR